MKSKLEQLGGGATIVGFLQEANYIGFLNYDTKESTIFAEILHQFEDLRISEEMIRQYSEKYLGYHVFKLLGDTEDGIIEIQYRGKPVIPSVVVIARDLKDHTFKDAEIILTLNDEDGNNFVFANLVNTSDGWQIIYYGNRMQTCSTELISHDHPNRSAYLEETRTILIEIYNQMLNQLTED